MHTCANANSCAADSNSNSTPANVNACTADGNAYATNAYCYNHPADSNSNSTPANVNACTADGNAYATNTYCYNHPADSNSNTASDSYASENHRDRAGQPRGLKGTRLLGQEDRLFHSRRESHHQPEWTIV
jgi:hypothetical protein